MSKTIVAVHPYTVSSDVADVAREYGWELIATIPRAELQLFEEIWETPHGAQVRYIDDDFIQVPCVTITGAERAEAEEQLRKHLRTRTNEEAMSAARNGTGRERAYAIRVLAAVTSNVDDPAVVATVIAAADDADAQVRLAAIKAMARLASTHFADTIAKRLAQEFDAKLRPEIEALSAAFRRHKR